MYLSQSVYTCHYITASMPGIIEYLTQWPGIFCTSFCSQKPNQCRVEIREVKLFFHNSKFIVKYSNTVQNSVCLRQCKAVSLMLVSHWVVPLRQIANACRKLVPN